ncbi:3'-5' exonuclease [Chloroflexota bacterium]
MEQNEELRLIAVGDDDQNIFEFRGSSSEYLKLLLTEYNAKQYELVENFRSANNLVDFSNQFAQKIENRLKQFPISAFNKKNGKIKLIQYQNGNIITPLVNDISKTDLKGTTGVLTHTNDEAIKITGLLINLGISAKLIQTNDGFDLNDLIEIRYFLHYLKLSDNVHIISNEAWDKAKRLLNIRFRGSTNIEICNQLVREFENTNLIIKYRTDLMAFIMESKFEDFYSINGETILVSTMHKAKGREFDNIFLHLDRYPFNEDTDKRLLYVALTRAKGNLHIHHNSNFFNDIRAEALERIVDKKGYVAPNRLIVQLSHRDVWLDHFYKYQPQIIKLTSGDNLSVSEDYCYDINGSPVVRFSKQFVDFIKDQKEDNYIPKFANIRFIVIWKKIDFERVKNS